MPCMSVTMSRLAVAEWAQAGLILDQHPAWHARSLSVPTVLVVYYYSRYYPSRPRLV